MSTMKTLKEVAFVSVKSKTGQSVVDSLIALQDSFCKFASGEIGDGGKNIDIQTTEVKNANSFILYKYST